MRALDNRGHAWRLFDGSDGVLRAQGEPDGYCGGWLSTAPLLEAKPDPNDGPTKGGFLDAIRVAFGDPTIHTSYSFTWKKWYMYRNGGVMGSDLEGAEDRFSCGAFDDEWSALEAAWEAAP